METSVSECTEGLRVDLVGSFLRPDTLKTAYEGHAIGRVSDGELTQAQDKAILDLIAREEAVGLPIVTDGEFRRTNFHQGFAVVAGMERWHKTIEEQALASDGPPTNSLPATRLDRTVKDPVPITERLRLFSNRPVTEFDFARRHSSAMPKVTLISIDRLLTRIDLERSRQHYQSLEELTIDIIAVQREIVSGLQNAGCQYIQIDGPEFTAFADQAALDRMASMGVDPEARLQRAIDADNAVIDGFDGITFGMHLCRGNARSRWHREGTYDPIAERVFNGLAHQRLLLEYDDFRSGDFRPLRFVPAGRDVVLGLITTKSGNLEDKTDLERRVSEAAKIVPVERLAISPQCGFASDIGGNRISPEDQWRKLELMMDTASRIW